MELAAAGEAAFISKNPDTCGLKVSFARRLMTFCFLWEVLAGLGLRSPVRVAVACCGRQLASRLQGL
jgi:hypothetical protein